jgi:hypothetical protein
LTGIRISGRSSLIGENAVNGIHVNYNGQYELEIVAKKSIPQPPARRNHPVLSVHLLLSILPECVRRMRERLRRLQ